VLTSQVEQFLDDGTDLSRKLPAADKDGGQSAAAIHSILVKIPVHIEVKPGTPGPP